MTRQAQKEASNNKRNPNQNVCAQAVARSLGVADDVRYLHTIEDLKRAVGKRWSCRSVKSSLKSKTAGGSRKAMKAHDQGAMFYVMWVPGHVLLMDRDGDTIVDTAPRKADRRKVLGCWGVYPKN
jgi:hypothetical protein